MSSLNRFENEMKMIDTYFEEHPLGKAVFSINPEAEKIDVTLKLVSWGVLTIVGKESDLNQLLSAIRQCCYTVRYDGAYFITKY